MPISVLVAGFIGFSIGAFSNLEVAVFCCLFFALIMWSITGFRVDNKYSGGDHIEESSAVMRLKSDSVPSDMSPSEFGSCLALSLEASCGKLIISSGEQSLLEQARLSVNDYHRELIVFCAAAQECAISALIKDRDTRRAVLHGYHEVWRKISRSRSGSGSGSGSGSLDLYQLFSQRRSRYIAAYFEDEPMKSGLNQDPVSSRISLVFAESLESTQTNPSNSGIIFMLATIGVSAYFRSHFEGVADAIEKARLGYSPGMPIRR